MEVVVRYPSGFPLVGYELALFDWSLRKLFKGTIYTHLFAKVALRAGVDPDKGDAAAILEELGELQYDDIEKLPPVLQAALPERIGQLMGVSIERPFVSAGSMSKWIVRAFAIAAISTALAAVVLVPRWRASREVTQASQALANVVRPAPVYPGFPHAESSSSDVAASDNLQEPAPAAVAPGTDFVVDSSVVSRAPTAQAARAVSMATLIPGAAYRVHVTVERVGQD